VRVLIVKRDKLGDLLLTTPVLRHLSQARPDAEIHLLANDYNAWVARGHPALARTWTYPRVRDAGRLRPFAALAQIPLMLDLRRQRFDVALVMGGEESPRGILRAWVAGARRTVAYVADSGRPRGLTDPLAVPRNGHEVDRMIALLAPLGIAPPAQALPPEYALPAGAGAIAQAWLAARGLAPDGYVVLGLGARRTKKQPDARQIVRWSTHWKREHGLDTVFMWTPGPRDAGRYPGDDDLAAPVLEQRLPHLHPFRGPVPEALGLIYHARTSVIPDSGLMHFAAASPGGVLGLFADPEDSAPAARWAPRGVRALHVEAPRRVSDLPDDVVLEVLRPLLDRSGFLPAR
jgi:heptosyltransferase-3